MTTHTQLAKIGQIITKAIETKGISRYRLEKDSGVGYYQIKQVEKGASYNIKTLIAIDSVLKSGALNEIIHADN